MTESEAFLAQARSDMTVFLTLLRSDSIEDCHVAHYLQMFTEKLAKAIIFYERGESRRTHIALSILPRILANKRYAEKLGYKGRYEQYQWYLRSIAPFCLEIERSCPALAGRRDDSPNTEYPWKQPLSQEWIAPCTFSYNIVNDIRSRPEARQLLHFLKTLVEKFNEIL